MAEYHKNGTRSFPNSTADWFKARPQPLTGTARFLLALRTAKYSILNIAPSVGNDGRFLAALRNW
jgi:hypothetical protein